jgi:hypothetical protein
MKQARLQRVRKSGLSLEYAASMSPLVVSCKKLLSVCFGFLLDGPQAVIVARINSASTFTACLRRW